MKEHKDAEFVCEVYPPNSTLIWLWKDNDLPKNKKFKTTSAKGKHTLLIKEVLEEDGGSVSAVIENDKTEAQLIVEGDYKQLVMIHVNVTYQ